jgi:hypothetical protein
VRRFSLLLFGVLSGVVAVCSEAAADRIIAPLKCHVDGRGNLHVEAAPVRMHRLAGRREERTHRICARENGGGPCRTLVLHKFAVECTGGRAEWRDIVAELLARRVQDARVRANKLSFRLRSASLAALNVLCDSNGRPSVDRSQAERHWQLDATCYDFDFVVRHRVELPPGFAPLREIGGRILVSVAQSHSEPPPAPNRKPWPNVMHVSAGLNPTPASTAERTTLPRVEPPPHPIPVAAPIVTPDAKPDAVPTRSSPLPTGVDPPAPVVPAVPRDPGMPRARSAEGAEPSPIPAKSWQAGQHIVPAAQTPGPPDVARPDRAGATGTAPSAAPVTNAAAPTARGPIRVAAAPAPQPRNSVLNSLAAASGVTPQAATTDSPPVTLNSWNTLVEVIKAGTGDGSSGEERRNAQQSIITTFLSLTLLTSLLFSGLGLFAGRHFWGTPDVSKIDPYQVMLRNEVADLTKPDAQMCGELCRSAQGLVAQINDSASDLNGVAPLRRVLLREVRNMEKFLAATMKEQPVDTPEWRRTRYRLQRVVTDLLRLKDITEGARRSLTTAVIGKDLPRDKYEAYEVLGANADASEAILKRLVDALRATWHPDHAVNEDDRLVRENRIKQINVAWDLLQEKRVEA